MEELKKFRQLVKQLRELNKSAEANPHEEYTIHHDGNGGYKIKDPSGKHAGHSSVDYDKHGSPVPYTEIDPKHAHHAEHLANAVHFHASAHYDNNKIPQNMKVKDALKLSKDEDNSLSKAEKKKKPIGVPPVTIDPADHPSSISTADAIKLVKEDAGEMEEALKFDKNGQWSLEKGKQDTAGALSHAMTSSGVKHHQTEALDEHSAWSTYHHKDGEHQKIKAQIDSHVIPSLKRKFPNHEVFHEADYDKGIGKVHIAPKKP